VAICSLLFRLEKVDRRATLTIPDTLLCGHRRHDVTERVEPRSLHKRTRDNGRIRLCEERSDVAICSLLFRLEKADRFAKLAMTGVKPCRKELQGRGADRRATLAMTGVKPCR